MIESKEKIVVGRRTAGYALSMFRAGVSESELISGYLANTKKDIDHQLVVYLWKWLKSIYSDLPERTKTAWGTAGDGRKSFFNWLYQLKHMQEFRAFAFEQMKQDEKEAAALSVNSSYGQDVDISGYPDLAEFNVQEERNRWESWILSGAGVPYGDNGAGAVNTPF